MIKKSVALSGNYSELSYEKPLDYKRISTLLLLFNVESVRKTDGHAQRFPFDKFKRNKGSNVTWSLEHIHAQQSEGMKTIEAWKEWLSYQLDSLKTIRELSLNNVELIFRIEQAINKPDLRNEEFMLLQGEILKLLTFNKENYIYKFKS